jgi:hypothetical protein
MKKLSLLKSVIFSHFRSHELMQRNFEFLIIKEWGLWPERNKNPLTRNPRRYFSQSDEDGILEKILIRLGIDSNGKILEFGVGDGRENNSLALISKGWGSYWVGDEEIYFPFPMSSKNFHKKVWITLDNLLEVTNEAFNKLEVKNSNIDIVSMDLDGNDWHFVSKLLEEAVYPAVWICEYNSKFPPGASWVMPYDANHIGGGNDFYGASYTAFVNLFKTHHYIPVACSVQGANIFFVRNSDKEFFKDVELSDQELYQPPLFYLAPKWGHTKSKRTLESIFLSTNK